VTLATGADLWLLAGVREDDDTALRLERAERLLASELRRPRLSSGEVTEVLRLYPDDEWRALNDVVSPLMPDPFWNASGPRAAAVVYPTATPVTDVDTPDCSVRSTAVIAVSELPDDRDDGRIEVTYTAGWTADNVPEDIRMAIVAIGRALQVAGSGEVPAPAPGVAAVTLDGASVRYDATGSRSGLVARVVPQSVLNRWRRR
jgi:hypothetical protein